MQEFQSFIYSSDFSIVGVSETWLTSSIWDNEILPHGFTIYRNDRKTRGGGVLIAVKNSIPSELLITPGNIEAIAIRIHLVHPIVVCCHYIPPNLSMDDYSEYFQYLSDLANYQDPVIAMGDFNLPDINWATLTGSTAISNAFCDLVFELNLAQLVSQSTHSHGNILDLVLTNKEELISSLTVQSQPPLPVDTDHYIISFNILLSKSSNNLKNPERYYAFDFLKADIDSILHHLSNSELRSCFLYTDVEDIWNIIKSSILASMHKYIPKYRLKSHSSPKWFTSEIRHLLNCLKSLRKRFKLYPTQNNLNRLKSAESNLQHKISKAKADYEQALVNNCSSDQSKLYQYINSITRSRTIPLVMHYDSVSASSSFDKACLFNDFFFSIFTNESSSIINLDSIPVLSQSLSNISFSDGDVYEALINLKPNKAMGVDNIGPNILKSCASVLYKPLHYLFTLSVRYCNCKLPNEWSIHCITPVFKSGKKNSVKNYRPISLLCNTSKILEKIIYDKIIGFVSKSISPAQFGALKGRSTIQQLMVFLHYVFNSKAQTDTIYLDIQKAFDSIPHCKLLSKLWSFGITGRLWRWFQCYLSNRTQVVKINNVLSNPLPVLSGVPQGSILGPVLFLIYMNDLSAVTTVSKSLLFVDDTKCFNHVSNTHDTTTLQCDLDSIARWSIQSSLKFNVSKTIHLSFKSKIATTYKLLYDPIITNTTHKDLGIILSTDLSWNHHHEYITSKAYRMLGLLRRTLSKSSNLC